MSGWNEEPAAAVNGTNMGGDHQLGKESQRSPSPSSMRSRSRSPMPRDGYSGSRSPAPNHSPRRRERSRSASPRSNRSPQSTRYNSYSDRGRSSRPYGGRREPASPAQPNNIIGVFGLSPHTREQALEDIYREFGTIKNLELIKDRFTGESRCFGFVTYEEIEQATAARDKTNGITVDGRQIRVDFSKTSGPRSSMSRSGELGPSRDYPPRDQGYGRRDRDVGDYRGRSSYGEPSGRNRSRSPYHRRSFRRSPSRSPPPMHRDSTQYHSRYSSGMREYPRRPY